MQKKFNLDCEKLGRAWKLMKKSVNGSGRMQKYVEKKKKNQIALLNKITILETELTVQKESSVEIQTTLLKDSTVEK
jgi:hypothetical protein